MPRGRQQAAAVQGREYRFALSRREASPVDFLIPFHSQLRIVYAPHHSRLCAPALRQAAGAPAAHQIYDGLNHSRIVGKIGVRFIHEIAFELGSRANDSGTVPSPFLSMTYSNPAALRRKPTTVS